MATLNNTRISDTYFGLIKTIDNAVISATLKQLTDGSGNATGLYINNAGDFKVNSILEFGSLKDTGENITISKFVDAADGIGNNNNDTSIPTSAAVVSYVAAQITAEDLDFTGDDASVAGDVDLNSEQFRILGTTNEIETSVVSAGGNQLRVGIVTNPALSGNVAIAGNIDFGDNAKARFGASQDLTIYHDGSNSYIQDSGTGNLYIQGSDNVFIRSVAGESYARFTNNGAVELSYDNSVKLATNSSGLSVTGKISNLTDPTAAQDAATKAYVDSLDAASDLDFSGDSGTGDVSLNTQTFAVTGTTNQITTSASGQTLNLSLPSTVHRNLQGNVTGNLTGNVTGNVTGNITGTVNSSSVLADGVTATTQSTGDNSTKVATTAYVDSLDAASDLDFGGDGGSTGAVVLNTQSLAIVGTANEVETSASNQQLQIGLPSSINVNSASATALQTARDISLTGQATATISSFDGSSNVSGAVTLDNDSVTGKVLTGLASPTASNILASDSILQAFGKAQSQINTLAGGLRFMGTWNANTNTPTLQSGGGEADSGTTTGTATNKLIQSGQNFTSTVTNGDKVINQASGATALVTNVDSNTQLTLDADIMVSGQEYTIDNSPFITQGHYFVVSVGGTSSLNGLSNWAVGDWVIAGAGNVWEKLDHTQVDGTGTAGNITKWSSTNVIADSIMAESGSTITVTGGLTTTQNLLSEGTFTVHGDATIGDNFGDNHTMNGQLIQTSTEGIGIKLSRRNGTTGLLVSSSGDSNVHFGTDNGSGSNTHHWTIGKDNSDNAFRISAGSVLGTGDKIKITGSSTTSYQDFVMGANAIKFADGGHLYMGDSNDLQLYHDSNDGFLVNNTGILNITNNDIRLKTSGAETMLRAVANGAVELMYDNSVKFATTDKGITISNVNATSAASSTVDEFKVGSFGAGRPAIFFGTSNTTFTNSTWYLENRGADGKLVIGRNGLDAINILNTGYLGINSGTPETYLHILSNTTDNQKSMLIQNSTTGDASLMFNISGDTFTIGIDNSDSDQFKISAGALGTNDRFKIDANGKSYFPNSVVFTSAILGGSSGANGGIRIHSGGTKIFSVDSNNSATSGVMDLGASDAKWKDLYLSNDVNLGGEITQTGSNTNTFGGDITISKSNARLKTISGSDQLNIGNWDGVNYRFEGDANRPIFITSYEGNINLGISGNTTMNIATSAVGIGGVSSGSKLEIVGGGYNSIRIGSTQAANTNKLSGISMNNYEGNGTSIFQTFCQNNVNAIYYGSADSGFRGIQSHYFMVNADSDATTGHTTAMQIGSTGYVGIGRVTASYKLSLISNSTVQNGIYISAGTGNGNHSFYVENQDSSKEHFAVRGDGEIRMGASGEGHVIIGSTTFNGSFGASNSLLAIKGNTSGGEGILQITGLGNNATDNVGRIDFHSYNEADPMASIRSVRGNADDVADLEFYTNSGGGAPSKRMVITDLGKVGINNADPSVRLELGTNDSEVEVLSVRYSTVPAYISSSFDGSYALSTFSTNQYNTSDGSGGWGSMANASYGTASVQLATNTQGGEVRIFTAPGANQDPTERLRINKDGHLLFNLQDYSTEPTNKNFFIADSGSGASVTIGGHSGTHTAVLFRHNGATTPGSISITTNSTAYNTSSDYRLKEDLKDFNGLEKVSDIKVYDFKWKADESRSYGVMAHELKEVLPQAVVGEKDAEEMQSVDYSKIVPLLVKSIQELKAEVDSLKKQCNCK